MQSATSCDLTSLLNNDSLPFFQSSDFTSDFDLAAQMLSNINLTTTNTALFTNASGDMGLANDNVDDDDYRNLVYEISDEAVANTPATLMSSEDDFDHGSTTTTLSSTLEHYSSASAALNDDHVDLIDSSLHNAALTDAAGLQDLPSLPLSPTTNVTNLTDTNALFHQLLCANLLLDELNFNRDSSMLTDVKLKVKNEFV